MLPTADINTLSLSVLKIIIIYEQTRYPDSLLVLVIILFVNCCGYVTHCFNLFIGITSLYLLNSFVNIAQRMFCFVLPSFLIEKRSNKFYMLA